MKAVNVSARLRSMRMETLAVMAGALISVGMAAFAADPAVIEKGKAEERRACTGCHGLRIIHVQRLPRGTWDRELTKMAGWGTAIADRESLLEYLVASYGDDKPIPSPPLSKDGSSGAKSK